MSSALLGALTKIGNKVRGVGRGIKNKAEQFGRTAKSFVKNPGATAKRAVKDIGNGIGRAAKTAVTMPARNVAKIGSKIGGVVGSNKMKRKFDRDGRGIDDWSKKDTF